ncbi:hypothetical protein HY041_02085 [Candidatus Roizmanbacteria bacterium]|nr:hypothetical protein [Candidatus Roizmanbacteria bacterium]
MIKYVLMDEKYRQQHIVNVLRAQEKGRLDEILFHILEYERSNIEPKRGTGNSPSVTLAGKSWLDFIQDNHGLSDKPISVLEIGGGDDARLWTEDINDLKLDSNVVSTRKIFGDRLSVVVQSGREPSTDVYRTGIVSEYVSGHFLDVLKRLYKRKLKFDIILSRGAIYQSAFSLELLPFIDQLLNENGAAFLDKVGDGRGANQVAVFENREHMPDLHLLTREALWSSLNFKMAEVGGLPWETKGTENVAWQKGQMQYSKLPKLVGVNWFAGDYLYHNSFIPFYLMYTKR